jgi:hypothetical protein
VSFSSCQAGASSPKPSPESGRKVTSPKTEEGPTLSPFLTRSPALGVNLDLPKEEEASSKIIISDVAHELAGLRYLSSTLMMQILSC